MVDEWLFFSRVSRICRMLPLADKATEQTCVAVSILRMKAIRRNVRDQDDYAIFPLQRKYLSYQRLLQRHRFSAFWRWRDMDR